MDVNVLVAAAGPDEPPAGTPVVVEIRDTSLLDVASTTVSTARTVTGSGTAPATQGDVPGRQVIASVDLTVPDDVDPRGLTVWARVATGDHEHVTAGDWITVQAYPLQSETVLVEVVPV
ncbi:hypothetical protein MWU75_05010 [Ornithinimicrobium sp. F0845]|uniref:hypothetical protein n=1 Tax=Ornithinimicrobium sp. F0845 TaxID=2926412 RepID=UPI001FF2F70A|nr:hypothetical protein [Ornithinimicrobium sp. F0845]MCK0111495.1 hypothetical protein [Ornithinimicrobium sp. F0845]